MKYSNSAKLLAKAKRLIPSASQTYSKSYKYFCEGAAPAFLERGKGAHVWDVDGNEFIDMNCSLGAVTVGYNDQRINAAIAAQLKKGISFSQANALEVALAEKIVSVVPCAEMVRFVKNGSDATAAAIRLARAFTGREIVLCCGYHGFQDWYVGTTPNHAGVPAAVRDLTKVFPYNDIAALERLIGEHGNNIAAVIMEAAQLSSPGDGYLAEVKALTKKSGAVLVFDEVVTGFRLALGGAQEYFDVIPDLCAIGKGMGNGVSLSAIAGRADIMEWIDRGAFISCTFGGETLSLAGALATINILEENDGPGHFWKLGSLMKSGLETKIHDRGLEDVVMVSGLAPHSGLEMQDHEGVSALEFASVCQQSLFEKGILSLGINNFCLAHSVQDIEEALSAYDYALDKVKEAKGIGTTKGLLKGQPIRPVFARNN